MGRVGARVDSDQTPERPKRNAWGSAHWVWLSSTLQVRNGAKGQGQGDTQRGVRALCMFSPGTRLGKCEAGERGCGWASV